MPHGVVDKPRTDRRGIWRERMRPFVLVIGSLAALLVIFAVFALVFAHYYVEKGGN